MELSEGFMSIYEEVQLTARVESVKEELEGIHVQEVGELIFRNEYVSGLILSIHVANLLREKGYEAKVVSYSQGFKTFFAVLVNEVFIMDVERENICIHYEKAHLYEKIRMLRSFYRDGMMSIKSFVSEGGKKEGFYVYSNIIDGFTTIDDFVKTKTKLQIN